MRDVLADLLDVWEAGGTAGVGTVVRTFQSAPRPPGASMVVAPDGSVSGSVSGGCVEGAVYELANEVVREGDSATAALRDIRRRRVLRRADLRRHHRRLRRACFADHLSRARAVADDIAAHRPVAVATVIAHADPDWVGRRLVVGADSTHGTLGSERADGAVIDDAAGLLAAGRSEVLTYGPDGQRRGAGMEVFVAGYAPRPRMLIFGAIDFAAALARQGSLLGYRVTVCDARPVFATARDSRPPTRSSPNGRNRYLAAQHDAGEIDARTVICVLTHDPKFDVPLLEVALRLPEVGYMGAMGSRRTHDDRLARLREAGLTESELARLASPIGLDLGARTPEETAVSIAAEIIARRWGGGGRPLADVDGRIHHEGGRWPQ